MISVGRASGAGDLVTGGRRNPNEVRPNLHTTPGSPPWKCPGEGDCWRAALGFLHSPWGSVHAARGFQPRFRSNATADHPTVVLAPRVGREAASRRRSCHRRLVLPGLGVNRRMLIPILSIGQGVGSEPRHSKTTRDPPKMSAPIFRVHNYFQLFFKLLFPFPSTTSRHPLSRRTPVPFCRHATNQIEIKERRSTVPFPTKLYFVATKRCMYGGTELPVRLLKPLRRVTYADEVGRKILELVPKHPLECG